MLCHSVLFAVRAEAAPRNAGILALYGLEMPRGAGTS